MKIKLTNVRLAFPKLFEARAFDDDSTPRFEATFLMPKGDKQLRELRAAIVKESNAKWGEKGPSTLATIEAKDRSCLQDGDDKEDYAGFEGNMAVKATSKVRPLVLDADRTKITNESEGRPYAGCYVNASVDVYAYDNKKFGKRMCATLLGVQFYRDGDAFAGGAPASVDDFDDVSEGADADDLV